MTLAVLSVALALVSGLAPLWYGLMGLALGLVVCLSTITLHARASHSRPSVDLLAPSYPLLQTVFNTTQDALILIDRDGRIALANPAVERLLGVAPARLLGRTVESLIDDSTLRFAEQLGFAPAVLRSLTIGVQFGSTDEIMRHEQRSLAEIDSPQPRCLGRTLTPVVDERGNLNGLLIKFADVTPERSMIQGREALYGMIVHDLRGPLTAINTGFKLLNEIASGDDPVSKAVSNTTAVSQGAVNKLLALVNSLLDVAKFQNAGIDMCRKPVALSSIVMASLDAARLLADEMQIEVLPVIPDALPLLDIDEDLIGRALLNLLDNALKFTPTGGTVTMGAHVTDNMMRVEVRDTGPGIPDEDKQRVFDLFCQTHGAAARRRGSGIGLTFCKLVVEAHGGQIWIEDNVPGGAVFVLMLPLYRVAATVAAE